MRLAAFIESNKDQIIERWKRCAVDRLGLRLDDSQLVNDLPVFIDEVAAALESPDEQWPPSEGARRHGRQRLEAGMDIGGLTEEMTLVGEVIVRLADEGGWQLAGDEVLTLMRVISHGTSTSVKAYASMRDQELADQAVRHFSFVAHEIRTPLHNARLIAEILGRMGVAQAGDKHLKRLVRSLEELSDLVDNSLVDARLHANPKLHVQQFEARAVVEAAFESVAPQAESRGLEVTIDVEPFELHGDRKLVHSALTNLIKNAVKFTRDGGGIRLAGRSSGNRALFEIEDECGGMPEDLPSRLFEPFVQGSVDRTGFGLGLVIVKQAAEAHGGTVRINNLPGRGCCFVLELPLLQNTAVH
jgi:signal transduction histidine kinase